MKTNNQKGFSLIELLVVVVVVGILAAISVIGYQAVVKGTRDSVQTIRLMQYVDAQNKYKQKGSRRYGTMQELYDEGLLNQSVIKYEGGNQVAMNDWMLRPGDESTEYLRDHFFVTLYKPGDEDMGGVRKDVKQYCIGDDGILRSATIGRLVNRGCSINSAPVEP